MKKFYLAIIFSFNSVLVFAQAQTQSEFYTQLSIQADSLFKKKDFVRSSRIFTWAFRVNNWRGTISDRYKAACSWSMCKNSDSAFYHLIRIVEKGNYSDLEQLTNEPLLTPIHLDARWPMLLETVTENQLRAEANYDKPLKAMLDSIYDMDQSFKNKIATIRENYGYNSAVERDLTKIANSRDLESIRKVTKLIETYGWLGPNIVGKKGSEAIFNTMIKAHPNLIRKCMPDILKAVKVNIASPAQLAMFEDKLAVDMGQRQKYGSQVNYDEHGEWKVAPIEDEKNVDKRRAQVGLPALTEYLKTYGIQYQSYK
ncbi:DUF6624 domain-containing protein [Solitalea koreensis]|uniref:Uncharacterized protein n=1 Tax=Solitalea koreensis TaxID=543615 RepID=A0A521DAX0_9SPHI|nr:DUF6624 domain-containing protein [Solitalea koreensis]SMO68866.1 hypothetical protein SAMN06265350_106148 [Solitalea koreensis]